MSHTWPRISVVTPSFNQGAYLQQTIESVLDQGYPNLEYIVMDGGSSDESVAIIRKYAKHLTYWVSETDRGQTDAINRGFARTTGEIFNWLNSDDFYAPGALRCVAESFALPNTDVVSGRRRIFGDGFADLTLEPASVCGTLEETLLFGTMDQPATFFRRSMFQAIAPLSTSLRYCMDTELWLAFLLAFGHDRIRAIPTLLANARLHRQAKTMLAQEAFFLERMRLYRSIAEAIGGAESLVAVFDGLGVPAWHERTWRIETPLDTDRLCALLSKVFGAYLADAAKMHRELASYYLYRHADLSALRASLSAVRSNPTSLINYRTLFYCLRRGAQRRLRGRH